MKQNNNIYIDASMFIAWQIADHINYIAANKFFEKNEKSIFNYSPLVIDEIIFILKKYGVSKITIVDLVKEYIIYNPHFKIINSEFTSEALMLYLNLWSKNSLKPRDAMHLFHMRKNHIKVIATFDQDFIKQQKKLGFKAIN